MGITDRREGGDALSLCIAARAAARRGLQALDGHPGGPFVVAVEELVEVAVEAGNADDRVIDEQEQLAVPGRGDWRIDQDLIGEIRLYKRFFASLAARPRNHPEPGLEQFTSQGSCCQHGRTLQPRAWTGGVEAFGRF